MRQNIQKPATTNQNGPKQPKTSYNDSERDPKRPKTTQNETKQH